MGNLAYSFQPKVIMKKKWKKYNIITSESVICCVQNERNKKRPKEKRAFLRAARDRAILTNVTQSDCVTLETTLFSKQIFVKGLYVLQKYFFTKLFSSLEKCSIKIIETKRNINRKNLLVSSLTLNSADKLFIK